MSKFSKREGHFLKEKEITIKEDAPQELREFIIMTIYEFGYSPSFLRRTICKVLRKAHDIGNWTEYPNIENEVLHLISDCEWFLVYDIIEGFIRNIKSDEKEIFQEELNDFFKANGIGWKLENGQIETRGNAIFETAISTVTIVLKSANLKTARSEMEEAISDLSRRPKPDITGAIQHSLACLECVCREATHDNKATLGDLMKKASGIIPSPLDQAISKIWGFTSEQGRHLKEGNSPEFLEAELVVELSAVISSYLGKKLGGTNDKSAERNEEVVSDDDLPF